MSFLLPRLLKNCSLFPRTYNSFYIARLSTVNYSNKSICGFLIVPNANIYRCQPVKYINPKSLKFSSSPHSLNPIEFSEACDKTLDSLAEYFDELIETISVLKNGDITYSDGVITAFLGVEFGTYVINRQTPNQQIWLSSPTSGPKRYDLISGTWVYKHDSTTLHSLLDSEISAIVNEPVYFSSCLFGKK